MNLATELVAIRESAAIFPLTDRGFLRITGPDATRWLNGMVTNSIQSLSPCEGNYNFLLNAQGRIQGDCTIYRDGETFLLATDLVQRDFIRQHLDKFIIMDDVELAPAYENEVGFLLLGPNTPDILRSLALPMLEPLHLVHADSPHGPLLLLTSAAGCELRATPAILATLQAEALRSGAAQISTEAIEANRILEGRPKFGQDIRERDLPQETAQTHALHFSKGCYLGQEIVERIRSRGQVHRQFMPLQLTGSLPTLPAPMEATGKPAGEITSAIKLGDELLALGYVRREALKETLTYPGGTAAVRTLNSPLNSSSL